MARNPKVELRGHEGQVVHPITDGDCVIFPSGETLSHKLSEQEEVMYAPEVTNSSPMFRVGEGDNVDYSANVLDGAYQEAILKGQTYVNTIQEPSADEITLPTPFTEYEKTQSKTFTEMQDGTFGLNLVGQSYVNCIQEPSEHSYVALGENLEFQNKKVEYTTDGQIKSAMLNGMTLVNLSNQSDITLSNIQELTMFDSMYKKSTEYTFIITTDKECEITYQFFNVNTAIIGYPITLAKGINKHKYISPSQDFTRCILRNRSSEDVAFSNVMVIEGDYTNVDIPYFQGMQSVTMSTELENVCSRYNSSGAKNGKTFTVGTNNDRILELSPVNSISNYNFKPNTKYLMQFKISNLNLDGLSSAALVFSNGAISTGDSLFGDFTNCTVKVKQNGIYRIVLMTSSIVSASRFVIKGYGSEWEETSSTSRTLTISQIMCIEYQDGMENWDLPYFETTQLMKPLKVQTHNDYETTDELYQEKTISALEPITLRAIGNVKDTLDLSTGEYVQRIREMELDGSDDEGWKKVTVEPWTKDSYVTFEMDIQSRGLDSFNTDGIYVLSDKYSSITYSDSRNNGVGCLLYAGGGQKLAIRQTLITTLDDFKSSLQQNPIKVQYALANPITRKISLEYPNLQTYQDITHVQSIAMDGTLTPNIYLPSDISYKAMLKPNTSYNVIVDREVIDSTNQLTVNLGGTTANITANRTVVTTPSTLSNETLTFSGKDNRLAKAMLIEGGTLINGDLPHFDGIGDVHLGRVVENLCMANEMVVGSATVTSTLYTDRIKLKITKEGSCVETFELTKQLQNGKKYFVYCPWNCSNNSCVFGAAFKMSYNASTSYAQQVKVVDNKKYIIFTINEKEQLNPYTHFTIGFHGGMAVDTTMTIRRPIICEYVDGMENWDWESIGYFTGARNIGNEFMRISNKNLFDLNKDDFVQGSRLIENNLQVSSSSTRITSKNLKTFKCKPNTSYTVTLNNSNYDLGIYAIDNDGNVLYDSGWFSQKSNKTFTTNEKAKYFVFHCRKTDNSTITLDDYNYSSIQLEESSSATSYVAHKHNSLHILPDEQIPLTFVQGVIIYGQNSTWESAINNTNTNRIRTQLLDLEPNETYRISCGSTNHSFAILGYDNNLLGKFDPGWTYDEYYFTTTKDVHKYAINVKYKDNSNITPSVLHQVRLEKVTDVTLRSVGNIKDELDLTRGVYIQRIGEITFDGNNDENWELNNTENTTTKRFIIDILTGSNITNDWNGVNKYVCDKIHKYLWSDTVEFGITVIGNSVFLYNNNIDYSIGALKTWLSQNPVTVQYELETPIEHRINIPMKNEANQTITKPNGLFTLPLMYSETNHVDINSQIYPKVQSRDYISYPVIASPSNKYTVFHNKLGTGNLTVNLCGTNVTSVDGTSKCTVTTPSSISQYELRLSGATNKVSNVCVFNGDYMNVNIPHVQGMMNAVNPTVKNIGKNLFDGEFELGTMASTTGVLTSATTAIRSINYIKVIGGCNYVTVNDKSYKIAVVCFDANKEFIRTLGGYSSGTVFSIPDNVSYVKLRTPDNQNPLQNDVTVNVALYKYEDGMDIQYKPYKENNCEPENGQVYLTQDMFEQGTFNTTAVGVDYETRKENQATRIRTKELIKVKPNTTYSISVNKNYAILIGGYDENKKCMGSVASYVWANCIIFTSNQQCNYICIAIRNNDNKNITPSDFDKVEIMMQEVGKEIYLRSLPDGVRDELNLETGEYIQRVGEINVKNLIDVEKAITKGGWDNETYMSFDFNVSDAIKDKTNVKTVISNLFDSAIRNFETGNSMKEFITNTTKGGIFVMIRKDRLLSADLNGFKQWLKDNDLVIHYELATPIIKQVDIRNYPHSYKDGHIIIENNDPSTNVTAQMTYRCVANRTGQIQEHTEQIEKQEHEINELEMLILENIRQQQNR